MSGTENPNIQLKKSKSIQHNGTVKKTKNMLKESKKNFVFKYIQGTQSVKHPYKLPTNWKNDDITYLSPETKKDLYNKCGVQGEISKDYFNMNILEKDILEKDIIIFKYVDTENNIDETLGFCLFHKLPNETIYIDLLCSKNSAYRNVGTLIMNEIIKLTKKNNIKWIELEPSDNAVGFYIKLGFSSIIRGYEPRMALDTTTKDVINTSNDVNENNNLLDNFLRKHIFTQGIQYQNWESINRKTGKIKSKSNSKSKFP